MPAYRLMTKRKKHTQKHASHYIWKEGYKRDELHQRTKEGILEDMISELNPTSCHQFSNLKKRNIFQVGKRNTVQSHRSREQHGGRRDSGQIRHHWSPRGHSRVCQRREMHRVLESPMAFYDRVRNMGTFWLYIGNKQLILRRRV